MREEKFSHGSSSNASASLFEASAQGGDETSAASFSTCHRSCLWTDAARARAHAALFERGRQQWHHAVSGITPSFKGVIDHGNSLGGGCVRRAVGQRSRQT